ncbi:MAG: ATP-binding cassette domain-containing protein [Gammaproteobacteria bacterium]|nr:ATP-binding cassette domain-containing protein [Gammaproteobacteria bacterium]
MSEPPLILAEHLSRHFGGLLAVDDISFSLQKGEVLGFLGPNGAGKSTTMNMLSGNLAPSDGEIQISGHDLLESPREAKAQIGYLPENPPLYREFTVREYLRFCARINGISRAHIESAMDAAIERCGLGEVRERLIGNLSKGLQQRVGIAQAVIHLPAVLILDEPTVGLDPRQIREIRGLIKELGKEHGIILSTHILPEVQASCHRVQIIHRGRLVYRDTIEALDQRLQHASLILALHRPPHLETLRGFDGVVDCSALGDGHFRIHYSGNNPAETLAQRAAQENWGLYELFPERASLEEVFLELTHEEASNQGLAS